MTDIQGLHPAFQHDEYVFRKKLFKLLGEAFHVFDGHGNLALYSDQKAFRLREDFRVYADEDKSEELLRITTPHVLDFSAAYCVHDSTTGEIVGSIKRKGVKSMFKDEWLFFAEDGRQLGRLSEASMAAALLSRFIGLIPQKYVVTSTDGHHAADISQHFNPLVLKYDLQIEDTVIDPRLLIAMGILLAGIEGRQD